jgi:hypothetical protein
MYHRTVFDEMHEEADVACCRQDSRKLTEDQNMGAYSPHFTRKSLRGLGASGAVRGEVFWLVDKRGAIGGKQYDAPGRYTTTQTENI